MRWRPKCSTQRYPSIKLLRAKCQCRRAQARPIAATYDFIGIVRPNLRLQLIIRRFAIR
jgi:hypothetical protein